ncbi:MAG: hypothetical protein AB7P22_00305 [Vicinamibacterales bacterium]
MPTPHDGSANVLLRQVSRAMFWNAAMLPVIAAVNLAAAVMIRRGFGLESGVYDVALGVVNTLLAHSALGVSTTIVQFVPALDRTGGRTAVRAFVTRVATLRLGLLLAVLVALGLFADQAAALLGLGASGGWIIRLVSVLVLLRAIADLSIKSLQALLAHFRANVVQLAQAVALAAAVAFTMTSGGSMTVLFAGLTALSVIVAGLSVWMASSTIGGTTETAGPGAGISLPSWSKVWTFALFMYMFEASNYFATPAFASVALAAAGGTQGTIAVFNVAFQFPLMIVTILLAGFQGLYRPLFASLMAEGVKERLHTTFSEISKVQTLLLVPAGIGLALLLPDYISLLFGDQFAAAAPLARALCLLLFGEALLNLGSIMLSVDRRYALTTMTQALRIAAAPAFVWLAVRGNLLAAATVFGAGRVLASAVGFSIARRLYGVRYPWAFSARVLLAALPMALLVMAARLFLPHGWAATAALTTAGALLTLVSARVLRVLGPREAGLLTRAEIPGGAVVARWLVPRMEEGE